MSKAKTRQAKPSDAITDDRCTIVAISRLDFPSDDYRLGLIVSAAEVAAEANAKFGIIACGLVNARYVAQKTRKLIKKIKLLKKMLDEAEANVDLAAKRRLSRDIARYQGYLTELEPVAMAKQLAETLPTFRNAAGEPITMYIYTSMDFDGLVGMQVAQLLAEMRPGEYRDYDSSDDVIEVAQAGKLLEVVVPFKNGMPSRKYCSTAVQKALEIRKLGRTQMPDLCLVGGFGVMLNKPRGEADVAYLGVPILHRQGEDTRNAENQVGVLTFTMLRDRVDPIVRMDDFKDMLRNETSQLPLPRHLRGKERQLVEMLFERGRMSTGTLADKSGISREEVVTTLSKLDNRTRTRRPTSWSGLLHDQTANRWGPDKYWMRTGHRYPAIVPREERKVDNIVAFSCLHGGSRNTDCGWFLREVPRVILETGANILVNAGDSVQGLKHALLLSGEVRDGLNVTKQEEITSYLITDVTMTVFRERFQKALEQLGHMPDQEELRLAVLASLITNVEEHGNHDDWGYENGFTPMKYMLENMTVRLYRSITKVLDSRNLTLPGLFELVESRIIAQEVKNEHHALFMKDRVRLDSGLLMGVAHPHMSRAETHSARAQQTLAKFHDCHLVYVGNFHVACTVGQYEPGLGERCGIELGTIMHNTFFEDRKNKTVDFGIAWTRLESHKGRVLAIENTFFTGNGKEPTQEELDADWQQVRRHSGI